jgi:hypothetical protein
MYTSFPIKTLQPHPTKKGGSIFTLSPVLPSRSLATVIRRVFNDASVLPSGIVVSLNSFSDVSVRSLWSWSSGDLEAVKLGKLRFNDGTGIVVEK